jgi:hypothetical protein
MIALGVPGAIERLRFSEEGLVLMASTFNAAQPGSTNAVARGRY